MYGAILGDMIGSPYEFDRGNKTKEFPLFSKNSAFTDDTVMTIAVAEAFLGAPDDEAEIRARLIWSMQKYGKLFPYAGYGGMFRRWLRAKEPQPYGSYGNGSAMRVSSVAWLYNDLATVRKMARLSAEVTHNHSEGIKGAEATASAIFLARTGSTKAEIKAYIEEKFHYDLSRTCDEIRPAYRHVESCQETVPEAITAFLEGNSFEDVIRTAVSLGGDCDTLTCIAGAIAEGFYGVPKELKEECRARLPEKLLNMLDRFKTIADCNCLVEGIIDQVIIRGQDFPAILVVRYEVDGHTFELKESVKLESKKKKLGFLTIGQKRVPVLGNTSVFVGSKVRVLYNSNNPGEAYLPDNIGKENV